MPSESQTIAQIMCDLTREIVWDHAVALANSHGFDMKGPLKIRVGAGLKTYHSIREHGGLDAHVITYGRKMIEMKKDYSKIPFTLTAREIAKKGFYGGDDSYQNILAHTVIHETAHAVQRAMGERHFNKVHNKAFYSILRKLHNACGQAVASELEQRAINKGVSLDYHPDSYDMDHQGKKVSKLFEPKRNEPVALTIKGDRCLGVVTDPGKLKSEVLIYRGKHLRSSFTASNSLLSALEPNDVRPDPEKDIPKTIAWSEGDKVHFYGSKMEYFCGSIIKVNPKRCMVRITECDDPSNIGGRVNVPKLMLHEGDGQTKEDRPKKSLNHEFSF